MAKGTDIPYSAEEREFLSANRTMPRRDLTAAFNGRFGRSVSVNNISAICKRNGWATGRSGRFEKGGIPFNKGTKGLMKSNKTSFRNGQMPHNTVAVGTAVVTKGWVKVKVAEPDVWRNQSELVWEAAGRTLEKDFLLIHLDGDFTNNALENLYPVRRADLLKLNRKGFAAAPHEVRMSMVAAARLDTETRRRQRPSEKQTETRT